MPVNSFLRRFLSTEYSEEIEIKYLLCQSVFFKLWIKQNFEWWLLKLKQGFHWQQTCALLKLFSEDKVKLSTGGRHTQCKTLCYIKFWLYAKWLHLLLVKILDKLVHKQFCIQSIQKANLNLLNWHPTLLHSAGLPHLIKASWCFCVS